MQQPLPRGCVKLCEIQVIAATAVGATISWLRQYLGEFWGPHTLEAVIFLEANKLSVFECFFWWWTPILWESDCLIEIFLCFSYTRKWRAICISSNSHTHSSSKNTTWCIKTFKTYCRDLLLPHFGLPGFFPPSLLGQVSGRYRGFTASWLWVAYYWKSEGGGKVGVGWDVGPKNAGWNHGEIRESMVKGDSGEEEQWLAAIWLSADEITHCNINKGMLPLENRNKNNNCETLWPFFFVKHSAVIWCIHSNNQPPFFGWKLFSRVPKGAPTDPPLHFLQTDLTSWVHQWPSEMPIEPRFWVREAGC